jgi:uracil phosphoribosyltransferase
MVHVSKHPLVLHKLAVLRDQSTGPKLFREMVAGLAQLLFYEATHRLPMKPRPVHTPLAGCEGEQVAARIGLLPILRAGLGMAQAILEIFPDACVWHLGLYRDHDTRKPVTYYNKLAPEPNIDIAIVVDPMLATGGSAVEAINILNDWGVKKVKFVGLIAAPEGVALLRDAHPEVPIYLAAIDSHLNELSYIVPGLGDAGDRQFGT